MLSAVIFPQVRRRVPALALQSTARVVVAAIRGDKKHFLLSLLFFLWPRFIRLHKAITA